MWKFTNKYVPNNTHWKISKFSRNFALDRTNRSWFYSCDRTRSHTIALDRRAVHILSQTIECNRLRSYVNQALWATASTYLVRQMSRVSARTCNFLTRTIFFIRNYLRIHIFSFVIQQPLFNLQPCWILTNWKSGEGLIMWQGRAGLMNWIWGKISHSPILL